MSAPTPSLPMRRERRSRFRAASLRQMTLPGGMKPSRMRGGSSMYPVPFTRSRSKRPATRSTKCWAPGLPPATAPRPVCAQQEPSRFLKPHLLLELEQTHPEFLRQGLDPQRFVLIFPESLNAQWRERCARRGSPRPWTTQVVARCGTVHSEHAKIAR